MGFAVCISALAGLALGCFVRWPVLAFIAVICLFAVASYLVADGHWWLAAVGWSFAVVGSLEAGYLAGAYLKYRGAWRALALPVRPRAAFDVRSASPSAMAVPPYSGVTRFASSDEQPTEDRS